MAARIHILAAVLFGTIAFSAAAPMVGAVDSPASVKVKKLPYAQYVHNKVAAVLDKLQEDNDYAGATESLKPIFDQAILYSPEDHPDAIREADFALRLVNQLSDVPADTRDGLLPYLRKHDNLASTLVFLTRTDRETPAGTYALLNRLRTERGDKIDKYTTLATAICLVHNKPLVRHINENTVKSVDPLEIFDYYVKHENQMYFGIKNVPAELLMYVVDTTATPAEMEWALNQYANNAAVGKLFFDITYDYEYLKRGTDKTVTVHGYNLQNILKYGGVCVDQAYFATTVGKAIGVPTAIDSGASAEAGHAWAGYLQYDGKIGFWNFDSGRYEAFKGVRGSVLNPQTRQTMPDSYVSLLGEIINTKAVDRQNSVALTDAAERLIALEKDAESTEISAPPADAVIATSFNAKPRHNDVTEQLGLIEAALKQSVSNAPAWFTVRDLAVAKQLTTADKRRWSDVLLRLGAQKYPDFTLAILMPMAQSIGEPQEQDKLLGNMLPLFKSRMDLSASILMTQAALWKSQDNTDKAGQCYMEVVQRYTNGGPFELAALKGAEDLLKSTHHADQIVALYEGAWSRTLKPQDMAPQFEDQSNWYQIGKRYADKLAEAGDTNKAADVRAKLGIAAK